MAEQFGIDQGFAERAAVHGDERPAAAALRVDMARALAGRPDVLLLDEPLGALDALTRLRLQQELRRLWQEEGITMLMVTHDIEEAIYLADRVVVMEPRPGRVRHVECVPLAHPRERGRPEFVAIRDRLHAHFAEPAFPDSQP